LVPLGTNGLVNMTSQMRLPALYGSGTLAVNVNNANAVSATFPGDSFSACANFSGTLNITGNVAGAQMDFYFNGGSFDGLLQNATINLITGPGGGVSLVGVNNSTGNTAQIGALNVDSASSLGGAAFANIQTYQIGALGGFSDIEGAVTGAGAIIKVGSGTLLLNNSGNTYTGKTTVSAGTLLVNGSISSPVNILGGTLGGSGTISAEVTNAAGGTFAPGANNVIAGTQLTITGDLTSLTNSTNVFLVSVNHATNDSAKVSGTVTYGGTLTILTNSTDTTPLAAGNSFVLFNASNYVGSFTSIQPLPGPGLAWTNDAINRGKFDVISTVVTPPPPVAGFSASPTNIFVTQTVTFTDASTGSITNWVWNYGDGSSVTNGSNASVNHAYTTVGNYTASLIVNGAGGSSTNTVAIVVKPNPVIGNAVLSGGSFILSGINGPAGQQYRILSSTNIALNVTNWIPVFTNQFASNGSYSYTNNPPTNKAAFFRLVSP
jgi:autotransporter-associated beta strand protein